MTIVVAQPGDVEMTGHRPGWTLRREASAEGNALNDGCVIIWQSDDCVVVEVDPTGVHPVYAARSKGRSVVGSSKAAVARAIGGADVDPHVVARHLGDWRRAPEPTIFDGIRRLPPGTRVDLTADRGAMSPGQAQGLDGRGLHGGQGPAPRRVFQAEKIRHHLEAQAAQLIPAGDRVHVALSGGVDSSALVAAIVDQGHQPVVWLLDDGYQSDQERRHAAALVERFDLDARRVEVDPTDLPQHFRATVERAGGPIINARAVAKYRFYAQVALAGPDRFVSGVGADDLFAGKPESWSVDSGGIPGFAAGGAAARAIGRELLADAFRVTEHTVSPDVGFWPLRRMHLESVTRPLVLPMEIQLPATMGVDVTAPFLSADMIGFARALGRDDLIDSPRGKLALRRAVEPLVGSDIAWQPKRPVYAPAGGGDETSRRRWTALLAELLTGPRLGALGCVYAPAVQKLLDEYRRLPLSSRRLATIERVLMHLASLTVLFESANGA